MSDKLLREDEDEVNSSIRGVTYGTSNNVDIIACGCDVGNDNDTIVGELNLSSSIKGIIVSLKSA